MFFSGDLNILFERGSLYFPELKIHNGADLVLNQGTANVFMRLRESILIVTKAKSVTPSLCTSICPFIS